MSLGGVASVVTEAAAQPPAEFSGWFVGDDADRAAFGIAPEQRTLRPAQHFDALYIEQPSVETLLATEVNAIDIDTDALVARRLVGVGRDDAANADGQR